jgi:hypothetical protein
MKIFAKHKKEHPENHQKKIKNQHIIFKISINKLVDHQQIHHHLVDFCIIVKLKINILVFNHIKNTKNISFLSFY